MASKLDRILSEQNERIEAISESVHKVLESDRSQSKYLDTLKDNLDTLKDNVDAINLDSIADGLVVLGERNVELLRLIEVVNADHAAEIQEIASQVEIRASEFHTQLLELQLKSLTSIDRDALRQFAEHQEELMDAFMMSFTIGVAAFVVWAVFVFLGGWVAKSKGRSVWEGCLLAGIFGPIGVLIEGLMPSLIGVSTVVERPLPATPTPQQPRQQQRKAAKPTAPASRQP